MFNQDYFERIAKEVCEELGAGRREEVYQQDVGLRNCRRDKKQEKEEGPGRVG